MKMILDDLEVVNDNYSEEELYDIGGNWACLIGCGTFCIMGGGATSYFAAVATAL